MAFVSYILELVRFSTDVTERQWYLPGPDGYRDDVTFESFRDLVPDMDGATLIKRVHWFRSGDGRRCRVHRDLNPEVYAYFMHFISGHVHVYLRVRAFQQKHLCNSEYVRFVNSCSCQGAN